MPVFQMPSPVGTALDALTGFLAQKKQNVTDSLAQQDVQSRLDLQKQQMAQDAQQFTANQAHQQFEEQRETLADQRAQQAEVMREKAQAALALHQAREDAVNAAKVQMQNTRDARTFAMQVAKINNDFRVGMERVKASRDVAAIHASASTAVASIHASASLQAAAMRVGAEERGQDITHQDRIRGQNLVHAASMYRALHPATNPQITQALPGIRANARALKVPAPADPQFALREQHWLGLPPDQQKKLINSGYFKPDELQYLSKVFPKDPNNP